MSSRRTFLQQLAGAVAAVIGLCATKTAFASNQEVGLGNAPSLPEISGLCRTKLPEPVMPCGRSAMVSVWPVAMRVPPEIDGSVDSTELLTERVGQLSELDVFAMDSLDGIGLVLDTDGPLPQGSLVGLRGSYVYQLKSLHRQAGHAMQITGYSPQDKMLTFRNDWGDNWGKGPYQLPEKILENWRNG